MFDSFGPLSRGQDDRSLPGEASDPRFSTKEDRMAQSQLTCPDCERGKAILAGTAGW